MDLLEAENFIAGEFVPCRHLMNSYCPATGKVWARIPDSSELEVDAAVWAAQRAFEGWSALPATERAKYLLKVADYLEEELSEFAKWESHDQGKPEWLATAVDIPRAILNLRHFAHTMPHQLNTSSSPTPGIINYTTREPIGVAGLISPWNLPLYLLTFKLAPAVMCGNTIVAKPSEMTSVTAYMLCKLFSKAGLPKGVVNMVFGTGPSAGEALVAHPDVPIISFTGSTLTGKRIAEISAPLFKKLSLELGGKNAAIVFDDCNVELAIGTLKRSSFINQGQVCLCTSRIFVHHKIYDDFLSQFVEVARSCKVGAPQDSSVFLGALNSKQHLQKVKTYISYAIEDGGKIECGETVDQMILPIEYKEGYYMKPTVITALKDDTRCMQEEIFGPVTCVVPFTEEEEVIKRANNTNYGLCASIFTNDLGKAHRVAQKLKVGTVWTNCWLVRDLDMPFGGSKQSGIGREGTSYSLDFYTESKTVCIQI